MDLYINPVSIYSHKALMAFHEKQVPFNKKIVQLTDPASREEYKKVYPLGKVPLLVTPEGLVPESTGIVEWLDVHYQSPKLIPSKAEDARIVRYIDRQIDLYLSSNCVALFFQSLRPDEFKDQEKIQTAVFQIGVTLDNLEQRIRKLGEGAEFIHGSEFSLADISLITSLCIAGNAGFDERYEGLQAYFSKHKNRASLLAAREGFGEAVEAMSAAIKKRFQK